MAKKILRLLPKQSQPKRGTGKPIDYRLLDIQAVWPSLSEAERDEISEIFRHDARRRKLRKVK